MIAQLRKGLSQQGHSNEVVRYRLRYSSKRYPSGSWAIADIEDIYILGLF